MLSAEDRKKAYRFAKRILGTHTRAKKKLAEMEVIFVMKNNSNKNEKCSLRNRHRKKKKLKRNDHKDELSLPN